MAENQNQTFSLGEHERGFIDDMVENGRFGNRTEVVRAGLRLLEDYEHAQKLNRLRARVEEGVADIEAGRVTVYQSADKLFKDIMKD
ncbi:type II toxin-antitoxin system ParD family antitoxin [Aliikangiella coralliicola]|uniref:Antitoxin ParD n=1 Tax=Aliikangiella coralliicola TaxID=2592383 RepID=A0A545UFQ1_9GAMM|nr:type II toxin-antitoxin system ParD family antitoxin [Aliikangiella coralliicola]TQV88304.1 type II toxin-antitoxin system ParD family antitoxin [Aliikangiella coralliicola]